MTLVNEPHVMPSRLMVQQRRRWPGNDWGDHRPVKGEVGAAASPQGLKTGASGLPGPAFQIREGGPSSSEGMRALPPPHQEHQWPPQGRVGAVASSRGGPSGQGLAALSSAAVSLDPALKAPCTQLSPSSE